MQKSPWVSIWGGGVKCWKNQHHINPFDLTISETLVQLSFHFDISSSSKLKEVWSTRNVYWFNCSEFENPDSVQNLLFSLSTSGWTILKTVNKLVILIQTWAWGGGRGYCTLPKAKTWTSLYPSTPRQKFTLKTEKAGYFGHIFFGGGGGVE